MPTTRGARRWSRNRWGPRVRRLLARRPWLYWLAIGVLATAAYAALAARSRAYDAARDRWADTGPVLVARRPIAPGDELAGAVARAEWPRALRPADALIGIDPDAVARQHVGVGEVVTAVDVAPLTGPLALVPDGWVVVPVVEAPSSGATLGERVRVVSGGIVVSADARVVGTIGPDVTLVAVPDADAATVSAAVEARAVVLVRRP